MKQVLCYVSPEKEFNDEHKMLAKIQIDNSLSLGWKPEDMILAMNFDYEYNEVKAIIVPDSLWFEPSWTAIKIMVLHHLMEKGLITELTWYHDFDCYQLNPFTYIEEDMQGAFLGLTNYGRMPRLCSASMFLNPDAGEFLSTLRQYIIDNNYNEEFAIMKVCKYHEASWTPPKSEGVRKLDITYALHRHNFNHVYPRAKKPIQAAHFHATPDKYDIFVRGINKANTVVIPERLISIFHQHGFDKGNVDG